jgi:hypothetical protein
MSNPALPSDEKPPIVGLEFWRYEMKPVLIALLSVALSALSFGADPMAGRYGNTVRITAKDGKITTLYYNADKSVTVKRPDGDVITGSWAIEGEQVCVSASVMLMSIKRCNPFVPDKKAGDTWTQKDGDGNDVSITIIPGRI